MAKEKDVTSVEIDPTVTETFGPIPDPTEVKVAEKMDVSSTASKSTSSRKTSPTSTKAPTPKSLGNTCENGCKKNVPDVVIYGEDLFKLLSKASSKDEGWMKSTKAMNVPGGVVIQVTTQQRNPDGSYAVAEAVTFVPGCSVTERNNAFYLR